MRQNMEGATLPLARRTETQEPNVTQGGENGLEKKGRILDSNMKRSIAN